MFFVPLKYFQEFLLQQLEMNKSWSDSGLKSSATVVPNRNHIDIVMDEFANSGSEVNQMVKNLMTGGYD